MASAYFIGIRKGVVGGLDTGVVTQPLSHIGGLVVNFMAQLANGVTNVIAAPSFNPTQILAVVESEGCSVLDGVPSHFGLYLSLDSLSEFDLTTLCKGTIGGAALTRDLLGRITAPSGMHQNLLTVSYGMTETSAVSFMGSTEDEESICFNSVGRAQVLLAGIMGTLYFLVLPTHPP